MSIPAQDRTLGCQEDRLSAAEWKRERCGQLQAECQILESLLRATREDLAELRSLHGRRLALAYGWLTPEQAEEAMRGLREFMEECGEIWIEGEHTLKSKGQAA